MANDLKQLSVSEDFPFALAISDPSIEDNPLVFVSDAFESLTGYARDAVIGRNCRFLQGENTDPDAVARLREAVEEEAEIQIDIYNYRADGKGFWNRLMLSPLKGEDGKAKFFVGIQHDLGERKTSESARETDQLLAEIQHRVKNHLSMVVGMIRVQVRDHDASESFDSLARRVEALQLLYSEMSHAGSASATDKVIPLGAYLGRIAAAISHIDGRRSIRVNFDADKVEVPIETAARTGLVFSEILTNSLQHAFEGRDEGVVEAWVKRLSGDVLRISIMDDGVGLPEDSEWPEKGNLGARIVRNLIRGLDAELNLQRGARGTTFLIDIPLDEQARIIARDHQKDAGNLDEN
ncbi:PAS domain-containing protein [Citromicrobium bathyomarinum]|uniref:PAS domain-containing protein n=1 Tax=Citromicrobium bathyomarinum TaxID=72174 RepID=UPI003159AC53